MKYLKASPTAICYQGLQSWFLTKYAVVDKQLVAVAIPKTDPEGHIIRAGFTQREDTQVECFVYSYRRTIEVYGTFAIESLHLPDPIYMLPDPAISKEEKK